MNKIWFPILGFFSNKYSAFVVTNVGITENKIRKILEGFKTTDRLYEKIMDSTQRRFFNKTTVLYLVKIT
jgi:hypothetical protein